MHRPALLIAAVALGLSLAACATAEGFRKRMEPTVGMTEAQLIEYARKAPDSTHDTEPVNGRKQRFIAFTVGGADTVPGYWQCIRGYCWVQPPTTYVYTCHIIFKLEDGIVRSYTNSGNGCVA